MRRIVDVNAPMTRLLRYIPTLLLSLGLPVIAVAQPREGLLTGAPDPTAVTTKNQAGETVYYVAATGRGVQLLRSTDLVRWEPAGHVFDRSRAGVGAT